MSKKGRQQIVGQLIELLLKNRMIAPEELERATEEQRSNGGRLESILVRLGYVEEEDLVSFLCNLHKVPFVKLSRFAIKPDVVRLMPSDYVRKHLIIPLHKDRSRLTLAMVDPGDIDVMGEVRSLTGFEIEPMGASEREIMSAIKKYYGEENGNAGKETAIFCSPGESGDTILVI